MERLVRQSAVRHPANLQQRPVAVQSLRALTGRRLAIPIQLFPIQSPVPSAQQRGRPKPRLPFAVQLPDEFLGAAAGWPDHEFHGRVLEYIGASAPDQPGPELPGAVADGHRQQRGYSPAVSARQYAGLDRHYQVDYELVLSRAADDGRQALLAWFFHEGLLYVRQGPGRRQLAEQHAAGPAELEQHRGRP